MRLKKYLVVTADDFGRSQGINHGIIEAHEHGIVTSASLMVRWPAAPLAARYARAHPELSVGLHVDLAEWVYREGEWLTQYQVVPASSGAMVAAEIGRQLARFRSLVGREPSHLDSHQHLHLDEPLRSIMMDAARRLAVPLRRCTPHVRYCGDFYGQCDDGTPYPEGIRVEALLSILRTVPAGITELGCHPGFASRVASQYRDERTMEVRVLCDPDVRAALAAHWITLVSFGELSSKRLIPVP